MLCGTRIAWSAAAVVATLALGDASAQWPQWGGPNRDFRSTSLSLAPQWSSDQPVRIWSRPLGNGTSGIAIDGDRLFTMFGRDRTEVIIAIDTASGATVWQHRYTVTYTAGSEAYGGPHATPAVTGDSVIAVGIDGVVHAIDRVTGAVRWRRDLRVELDVDVPQSGYAASPLIHDGLVLLPGQGAPGFGVIALRLTDGVTAWARHGFLSSHASPILIRAGGREHAVFHGTNRMFGLDPATGDVLWNARVRTDAIDNVSFTPLWDAERSLLVVSHAYDRSGTQAWRLSETDGDWSAARVWSNRRLKVEHGNGVLLDGVLYASDGSEPAYTVGVDMDSGATVFKQRGIGKATFLATADSLLVLDQSGELLLARPGEDQLEVLARAGPLRSNAWTVPSLGGRRIYLRDRFSIAALELP